MPFTPRTIARETQLEGVGIHSGAKVTLCLKPAPAQQGITFSRTDLKDAPPIRLSDIQHDGPQFRTTLKNGSAEVHTVEHLLSALAGLGISALTAEINGPEIPALDGSALAFVEALRSAGVTEACAKTAPALPATENKSTLPGTPLVIDQAYSIQDGSAHIAALPFPNGLKITYTLDYPGEPLAQGTHSITLFENGDQGLENSYTREIAPARTFCLKREAEMLLKAGFGKGAGTHNTLVLENGKALDATLRFTNEPVRHKILDLIGDLYMLGRPLRGHLVACRSGHKQNRALAALLAKSATTKEHCMSDAHAATAASASTLSMDFQQIQQILPHRYPFLLVDRVLAYEPGKRIVGIKNVSINEHFFQGHFPSDPVMPGVLVIEALAQVGAIMILKEFKAEGKVVLFTGMDGVAFRRRVGPGDVLRLEAELDRVRPPHGRYKVKATVDGELAAEALLKFMVPDLSRKS